MVLRGDTMRGRERQTDSGRDRETKHKRLAGCLCLGRKHILTWWLLNTASLADTELTSPSAPIIGEGGQKRQTDIKKKKKNENQMRTTTNITVIKEWDGWLCKHLILIFAQWKHYRNTQQPSNLCLVNNKHIWQRMNRFPTRDYISASMWTLHTFQKCCWWIN